MKNIFVVSSIAAVLALGTSMASAGVVVTQTEIVRTGKVVKNGIRTVMIQSDKEKIMRANQEIIIDIGHKTIVVLEPATKTFFRLPFPPTGYLAPALVGPGVITNFSQTGRSRTVAGYKCEEYSGTAKVQVVNKSITACFSNGVPGADEFRAFQRKLREASLPSPSSAPDGVDLSQQIITQADEKVFNTVPEQFSRRLRRQFSKPKVEDFEVTKVEVKALSDDTFVVPKGYSEATLSPDA